MARNDDLSEEREREIAQEAYDDSQSERMPEEMSEYHDMEREVRGEY